VWLRRDGAYFPGHGDKLLKAKFLEKVEAS
jgi:hypothetical protein